jgi:soluble lytic murein transglycosylase-like protein
MGGLPPVGPCCPVSLHRGASPACGAHGIIGAVNNRDADMPKRRALRAVFTVAALCMAAACTSVPADAPPEFVPPLHPNETPELRRQINTWADHYEVPRSLVHRVAIRESTHRPWARNGPYMGLMQIHPNTARGMGYDGAPQGLLDAETNLKYAVRYLRGAWMVSDGDEARAVQWYARGYYYEAKRRGLLEETGLR